MRSNQHVEVGAATHAAAEMELAPAVASLDHADMPPAMVNDRLRLDLSWSDTTFTVNHERKTILSDCWGSVNSSQICAILGPSGSGKVFLILSLTHFML